MILRKLAVASNINRISFPVISKFALAVTFAQPYCAQSQSTSSESSAESSAEWQTFPDRGKRKYENQFIHHFPQLSFTTNGMLPEAQVYYEETRLKQFAESSEMERLDKHFQLLYKMNIEKQDITEVEEDFDASLIKAKPSIDFKLHSRGYLNEVLDITGLSSIADHMLPEGYPGDSVISAKRRHRGMSDPLQLIGIRPKGCERMTQHTGFLIREELFELIHHLQHTEKHDFLLDHPSPLAKSIGTAGKTNSIVLDGKPGTGKSTMILLSVLWARSNGWVVLHIPHGYQFVNENVISPSKCMPGFWEHRLTAMQLLYHFQSAHASELKQIPLKTSFTIPYFKRTKDSTLFDLVDFGSGSEEFAGQALYYARLELSAVTEFPVMIAIDEYDAFWSTTGFADPACMKYVPTRLPAEKMAFVQLFNNFKQPGLARGLILGATQGKTRRYFINSHPGSYGRRASMLISPFTRDEMQIIADYFAKPAKFHQKQIQPLVSNYLQTDFMTIKAELETALGVENGRLFLKNMIACYGFLAIEQLAECSGKLGITVRNVIAEHKKGKNISDKAAIERMFNNAEAKEAQEATSNEMSQAKDYFFKILEEGGVDALSSLLGLLSNEQLINAGKTVLAEYQIDEETGVGLGNIKKPTLTYEQVKKVDLKKAPKEDIVSLRHYDVHLQELKHFGMFDYDKETKEAIGKVAWKNASTRTAEEQLCYQKFGDTFLHCSAFDDGLNNGGHSKHSSEFDDDFSFDDDDDDYEQSNNNNNNDDDVGDLTDSDFSINNDGVATMSDKVEKLLVQMEIPDVGDTSDDALFDTNIDTSMNAEQSNNNNDKVLDDIIQKAVEAHDGTDESLAGFSGHAHDVVELNAKLENETPDFNVDESQIINVTQDYIYTEDVEDEPFTVLDDICKEYLNVQVKELDDGSDKDDNSDLLDASVDDRRHNSPQEIINRMVNRARRQQDPIQALVEIQKAADLAGEYGTSEEFKYYFPEEDEIEEMNAEELVEHQRKERLRRMAWQLHHADEAELERRLANVQIPKVGVDYMRTLTGGVGREVRKFLSAL